MKNNNWRKRFDKLWMPSPKFKDRPEYKPAVKLCEEQKEFIAQELKRAEAKGFVEGLLENKKIEKEVKGS